MKGFLLSLQSEFYKSRKTLGFWSAVLLPLLLTSLISIGFYFKSAKLAAYPGKVLWAQFSGISLGMMGTLLLPIFIIFIAYSVNSVEHKSDTWKTLFTLPIPKWSIYSAKFFYAFFLILLCLMLFVAFTIGFGNLLGLLKPELKFLDAHIEKELFDIYIKLFLGSLAILALQFVMSLIWKDFLKPMGIGFVGTIVGVILVTNVRWEYAYAFPYAQPLHAIMGLSKKIRVNSGLEIFTNEVLASMGIATAVFILGYFIVKRLSIK